MAAPEGERVNDYTLEALSLILAACMGMTLFAIWLGS